MLIPGTGGLPKVLLRSANGSSAEVYLHGAHVTSWKPSIDGQERIFLSARADFRAGTAIRGGVPVIFPQFAAEGPLPRHSFARTSEWQLADVVQRPEDDAFVSLTLSDTPQTRAIWPHSFTVTLTVRLGGDRLALTLVVTNTDRAPLQFTTALHTYLRLLDVSCVELVGLHGVQYRDAGAPGVLHADESAVLQIRGEFDRVYVNAPPALVLRTPGRVTRIETVGFPDVVVWNPGSKAATLADMVPGDDRVMLCVEAGAVQEAVTLLPGGAWSGTQTLVALPHLRD